MLRSSLMVVKALGGCGYPKSLRIVRMVSLLYCHAPSSLRAPVSLPCSCSPVPCARVSHSSCSSLQIFAALLLTVSSVPGGYCVALPQLGTLYGWLVQWFRFQRGSTYEATTAAPTIHTTFLAVEAPRNNHRAPMGQSEGAPRRFAGNCNYCGRPGHKEQDCRSKAARQEHVAKMAHGSTAETPYALSSTI